MNENQGVMLDIETASNHETNALILSVGMVAFTLAPAAPMFESKNLWVPTLRHQLALGRGTSASTLEWWRQQSDSARAHWIDEENPIDLGEMVSSMILALKEYNRTIWAQGICFDIGNLSNLFSQMGYSAPWGYNAPRDSRTIQRTMPLQRSRPTSLPVGTLHDPIYDCEQQIWSIWERWVFDEAMEPPQAI